MTTKQTGFSFFILLIVIVLASASCRKEELNTDPDFLLKFSSDTVLFDTVFTTIGSTTRSLVIRNEGNSRLNIARIALARGKASPFRLNIDGKATEEFLNLEIGPKDSAYIFVKVTIDPNNEIAPLIETDSIVFNTNGNIQDVKLVAWGQDAYFHKDVLLTGDIILPNDKPHVIYGTLAAGNGCKLSIAAGTHLYFHNGSRFEIRSGASISVEGTLENPVTFAGDRLDDDYLDRPGLWEGIRLEEGSTDNSFTYAEIINAKVGIQADSCGLGGGAPLRLHNCLIHNMTNYGILANYSKIVATNCQITNCGGNVVMIEKGGDYRFINCTLARYYGGRSFPTLSISNFVYDTSGKIKLPGSLTGAYFGNCIITGSQNNEIDLSETKVVPFNFQFDRCLVSWEKEIYKDTDYETKFTNCISNEEAKFIDPYTNDFQLDTLSFAIDSAYLSIINGTVPSIILDRKGVSRLEHGLPDLGAYERVEKR